MATLVPKTIPCGWSCIFHFDFHFQEVLGVQERNKRKLPDATFEAKNAVLGFVFGVSISVI